MAYQFLDGRFRAETDAGLPAAGYKLHTYVSGTTTNKPTYTDSTLGGANTNPVILNARGEAQVWLTTGAYTFVLKTAADVPVWTVDGIQDPSTIEQDTVVDLFDGTGSQTGFTLSQAPGSAFNLDVEVDGISLVPSVDYNVSGTALTISTAPPSGTDNVVVKHRAEAVSSVGDATTIAYTQGGVGAVEQTVAEALQSLPTTAQGYGAEGDGIADDYVELQAAITATGSGTLALEKSKVYKISAALVCSTSGLTIEGNGATLDGSAIAASTTLDDKYALKLEGSIGSAVAITSDVAEGAVSIPVASTTGLAAGDMLLIYSTGEKWPEGAAGSTSYKGALHKIRSIDSGTSLTIMDGLFFAYASASGANIKKVIPVNGITINNLKVLMGGSDKAHSGIRLKYTERCRVINVTTSSTEDTGVRIEYSFGGEVRGGDFSNCTSPADGASGVTGVTGYGVCASTATRDFVISGASFRNCRHAIAGGGTYPAIAVVVRDNNVAGNRAASYASSYSLDCHEDCVGWVFDGNHISGGNTSTGSGGILVRGQRTRVVNNTVTGAYQYGIYVKNYDSGGSTSTGTIVSGNTISSSRQDAIVVEGASTTLQSETTVSKNNIYSPGGEGIVLFGTTNAIISENILLMSAAANKSGIRLVGTAATSGNQCKNISISSNVVMSPTLHGLRADYADSITVTGNVFMNTTSESLSLTNCTEVTVNGCKLQTSGASRSGIYISASTKVAVAGCSGENTSGGASGSSSGVRITGASADVSVAGGVFAGYLWGVYSEAPANYIAVTGINGRNCATASVDVSASANTATAGNL